MRSAVESLMTRLLAGGEIELAEQLVHPEFVNNEADPERRSGPSRAVATSEWLRSCFGNLRYDVPIRTRRRPRPRRAGRDQKHQRRRAGLPLLHTLAKQRQARDLRRVLERELRTIPGSD